MDQESDTVNESEMNLQRVPSHSNAVPAVLEPNVSLKPAEPGSTYLDMDTLKPVSQSYSANLSVTPELLHSSNSYLNQEFAGAPAHYQPTPISPSGRLVQKPNPFAQYPISPQAAHQSMYMPRMMPKSVVVPHNGRVPQAKTIPIHPKEQRRTPRGAMIPPGLGAEGPFNIDPLEMTRDILEAPKRGDNKMHGFIHAEMSVAKLKRLSTSGLMLMSVPKGHGLPNARHILQVIAGQRSRVDKEAFKKYMRNMKNVYDAHKNKIVNDAPMPAESSHQIDRTVETRALNTETCSESKENLPEVVPLDDQKRKTSLK